MTYTVDVIEVRTSFKINIVIYRYRYMYRLLSSFQEKLPDLCLHLEPEVMWVPWFCQPSPCHNRTFSGSHSENCVPRSPMKASQGSYFSTDSPSSGLIVTGLQVTTCPPTCSCQEGVHPLKSHFHPHGDEGVCAAQGGLPVAARPGVASSRLPGGTSCALLVKAQRHPGWALNHLKLL